jgi:hypothetical protein
LLSLRDARELRSSTSAIAVAVAAIIDFWTAGPALLVSGDPMAVLFGVLALAVVHSLGQDRSAPLPRASSGRRDRERVGSQIPRGPDPSSSRSARRLAGSRRSSRITALLGRMTALLGTSTPKSGGGVLRERWGSNPLWAPYRDPRVSGSSRTARRDRDQREPPYWLDDTIY